jgi:hypothetical protein
MSAAAPSSAASASAAAAAAAGGAGTAVVASGLQIPNLDTLKHAARMAIEQDKPIMLDYYNDTREGKAFIGENPATKEKVLVRSSEEYTSLIQDPISRVGGDFIVRTENSIYIVSGATKKRALNIPSM